MREIIAVAIDTALLERLKGDGVNGVHLKANDNATFALVADAQERAPRPTTSSNARTEKPGEALRDGKNRTITVKHGGPCARCGVEIKPGSKAVYMPDAPPRQKLRHFNDPNGGGCAT